MSNDLTKQPQMVLTRLSVMMFLQFFAWGAWFATLALAMSTHKLGAFIGGAYESAPIAAIIAPLFLGLIADRLFPSDKVMGVLFLIGGGLMCLLPGMAASTEALFAPLDALLTQLSATPEAVAALQADASANVLAVLSEPGAALSADTSALLAQTQEANDAYMASGGKIVWVMIAYMLCYMPTLGLGNSITFTHLPQEKFPQARVWGTIGWIAAGLGLGAAGWSNSLNIFWLGAVSSLLLGVYSFTLPHTPPPSKGKPVNVGSLLMLDAFKLLKHPPFLVFAVCSTLICIPLAYYYGQTSNYLGAAGFKQAGAAMTLGQMSEIVFMLLIPFFFRKLGVKMMLMIGMACWVARYALFAMGAPNQVMGMLLLAVALHGICYDFFFVTGFIYTDKKAPADIRGQAQSLLVFLTQGLGMFFGFRMAFSGNFPFTNIPLPNHAGDIGKGPANHQPLIDHITALNGEQEAPSFIETMLGMFGKGYPDGIDMTLVGKAMADWQNYWYFPAGMAAVILVIFAVGFWDKVSTDDVDEEEVAEAAMSDEMV
ncbi:MAG: MFS transporter [Planctomycetota bacterium]